MNTNINVNDFNLQNIKFVENSENFIRIYYNDTFFKITTPILKVPFGIKSLKYNNSDNKERYSIAMSINNTQNIIFYTFLKNLEDYIIKYVKKNYINIIIFTFKIYKNY
jgi:hypothetical protein